jgi:nicotinamidase-related amidase
LSGLAGLDLDPASSAFLAVDFQNDFCKPDGFFAGAGHDVAPCEAAAARTRALLAQVRAAGIPVVFTRSVGEKPEYRLPPLRYRRPRDSADFQAGVGGTKVFAPGSWGAQVVDELAVEPGDVVLEKRRFDAFLGTDLEELLRDRGVDTVVLTGVTTNCCVDSTARSAFVRGFATLVLSDCVAAFGNERELHDSSLRNLELFCAVVATSDEYADDLRARRRGR